MEKQYNYFYKIENTLNGKFYYGVHGTNNLEDGYLGSGKRIKYAIKKYGKENFVKENLLFFETYKQALDYEVEIVDEELILDPSCYNLKVGGIGGLGNNGKGVDWYKFHGVYMNSFLWKDEKFRERKKDENFKRLQRLHKNGKFTYGHQFKGMTHTKETKEKMCATHQLNKHQQKENNSQYGTCWITNEKENKKIHKGDLIPDGWRLGRKVKK